GNPAARGLSADWGASGGGIFRQDERASSGDADHAADVVGAGAFVAELADGAGIVALGEPLAMFVADQAVVVVEGRRQAGKALEEDVDARRLEEVFPARDMGDALRGIVHHDREVIGRTHVAAGEDYVADAGQVVVAGCEHVAWMRRAGFEERQPESPAVRTVDPVAEAPAGVAHVEPEMCFGRSRRHRAGQAPAMLAPARSGIDRAVGAGDRDTLLRGGEGGVDVAAGAGAGIEKVVLP